MKRPTRLMAGIMLGSLVAALPLSASSTSLAATAGHTRTQGLVGPHKFSDSVSVGATCKYSDNRLQSIAVAPPRVAARKHWGATGQVVQWSSHLQRHKGHRWHSKGQQTAVADGEIVHAGHLSKQPRLSLSNVGGTAANAYRVTERINWEADTTGQPVEGNATHRVTHYFFKHTLLAQHFCPASQRPSLAKVSPQHVSELQHVNLQLNGHAVSGKLGYSVVKGSLPLGLHLNPTSGLISGVVSAKASTLTTTYQDVKRQVFKVTVAATAGPREVTRHLTWTVKDTAFAMFDYLDTGETAPNPYPIEKLSPTHVFLCTLHPHAATAFDNVAEQTPAPGANAVWGKTFTFVYYEKSANCANPVP